MDAERHYFLASDITISEQKSNDIFLFVEMRMLSSRPNSNGEGVTTAFIDEICENPDKYSCLPLYVDIGRLRAKDYRSLGHMLNRMTGKFMSTQIGGMCAFRKVEDEYGVSLIGEARIPKREEEVCQGVMEMYALGTLNFSFEIKFSPEDTIVEDGVVYIDASANNALTGMAIVSVPAYGEARALSLVAEDQTSEAQKQDNEGVETMTQDEMNALMAQKDQKITELESAVAEAEKKVEDIEKEMKEKDDAKDEFEAEKKKCAEESEALRAEVAQKDAEIAELTAKVAELEPMKAELEAIRAQAEAAEAQARLEKAKAFAEKQGLDVEAEDVAKAIASLNYEALAEMAMANEQKDPVSAPAAGLYGDITPQSQYGGLLESR